MGRAAFACLGNDGCLGFARPEWGMLCWSCLVERKYGGKDPLKDLPPFPETSSDTLKPISHSPSAKRWVENMKKAGWMS